MDKREKLVTGGPGFLVRHRTRIAFAAARVFILAASVVVLTLLLRLATGHLRIFATVFFVATSRGILVVVLRVQSKSGSRY